MWNVVLRFKYYQQSSRSPILRTHCYAPKLDSQVEGDKENAVTTKVLRPTIYYKYGHKSDTNVNNPLPHSPTILKG